MTTRRGAGEHQPKAQSQPSEVGDREKKSPGSQKNRKKRKKERKRDGGGELK